MRVFDRWVILSRDTRRRELKIMIFPWRTHNDVIYFAITSQKHNTFRIIEFVFCPPFFFQSQCVLGGLALKAECVSAGEIQHRGEHCFHNFRHSFNIIVLDITTSVYEFLISWKPVQGLLRAVNGISFLPEKWRFQQTALANGTHKSYDDSDFYNILFIIFIGTQWLLLFFNRIPTIRLLSERDAKIHY